MKTKIVLGILVIALIVMTVPQLRVRVDPVLDRAGESFSEALHGPLSPIVNPYRRLKSESEIGKAVRELIQDRNMGYLRPQPDDFRAYMQREVEGEDGLDAWGTPYIILPARDSLAIVSAGPDLQYDTEDDLVEKIRYREPAYMRR
ncbi:MAG: hypothetical protein ACN0LA_05350 [Candidatus Longimicrobiales bacterium M2_2A_002]